MQAWAAAAAAHARELPRRRLSQGVKRTDKGHRMPHYFDAGVGGGGFRGDAPGNYPAGDGGYGGEYGGGGGFAGIGAPPRSRREREDWDEQTK